jgi:hypothetical protein
MNDETLYSGDELLHRLNDKSLLYPFQLGLIKGWIFVPQAIT